MNHLHGIVGGQHPSATDVLPRRPVLAMSALRIRSWYDRCVLDAHAIARRLTGTGPSATQITATVKRRAQHLPHHIFALVGGEPEAVGMRPGVVRPCARLQERFTSVEYDSPEDLPFDDFPRSCQRLFDDAR